MEERSDEGLMVAYRNGEVAAFAALFARYEPRLRRMLQRRLPTGSDVDDILQRTFLHLHRARFDFDETRVLRPWIYTICRNLLRAHHRRSWRERPLERELAAAAFDPETLDREYHRSRVRRALAELSTGQQAVIRLHWFEEVSFREIAARLGAGTSAVKVRAHRGYKKLRVLLEISAPVRPERVGPPGKMRVAEVGASA